MAQGRWVLKCEKNGIKVYTRKLDSTSLKAVKASCILMTSITTVTDVLLDINSSKEWMYATKKVSVLKHISPTEVIYYSEISLPWPISNRDFIADFSITQDTTTKVVKATCINKPGMLPQYKNIVRVEQSWSQWTITPLPGGRLSIEYELQVDPGGSVPAWLINLFATTGPVYTFQKLQEQVKKSAYNNTSMAFIKE